MKKILGLLSGIIIVASGINRLTSCNQNSHFNNNSSSSKLNLSVFNHVVNFKNIIGNKQKRVSGLISQVKLKLLQTFQRKQPRNFPAIEDKVKQVINNDLQILIYQQSQSQPLSENSFTKPNTPYYVSLQVKNTNPYFCGENNKANDKINISEIDFNDIETKLKKDFRHLNNQDNAQIIQNLRNKMQDLYLSKIKTNDSKSVNIVNDPLISIVPINAKNDHQQLLDNTKVDFKITIKNNDPYFLPLPTQTFLHTHVTYGQDINNLNLTKLTSALNGNDLYNQIYEQISKQFSDNAFDFHNDQNLVVSLKNAKTDRKIYKNTSLANLYQPLKLTIIINNQDQYFLAKTITKKIQLTKLNLSNCSSKINWNFQNANNYKQIITVVASNLANNYNKIMVKKISAADILNNPFIKIKIFDQFQQRFIDQNTKIHLDIKYKIFIDAQDLNPFFATTRNYLCSHFLLVTTKLTNIDFDNIKNLTSSENFYQQVYQRILNYYQTSHKLKPTQITIKDLENDKNLFVDIYDSKNVLLKRNNIRNHLKILVFYKIVIFVQKSDPFFQTTPKKIIRKVIVKKVDDINKNLFTYRNLNWHWNKISINLINQIYENLRQNYNLRVNLSDQIKDISVLKKDKNLKLVFKYLNSNTPLAVNTKINFHKILQISLLIDQNDVYYKKQKIILSNLNFNNHRYQLSDLKQSFANLRAVTNKNLINDLDIHKTILNFVNHYQKTLITWDQLLNYDYKSLTFTVTSVKSTTFPKFDIKITTKNNSFFVDGSYIFHVVLTESDMLNISGTLEVNEHYLISASKHSMPSMLDLRKYAIYLQLAQRYNSKFNLSNYLTVDKIVKDNKIQITIFNQDRSISYDDNVKLVPSTFLGQILKIDITVYNNDLYFIPTSSSELFNLTYLAS